MFKIVCAQIQVVHPPGWGGHDGTMQSCESQDVFGVLDGFLTPSCAVLVKIW